MGQWCTSIFVVLIFIVIVVCVFARHSRGRRSDQRLIAAPIVFGGLLSLKCGNVTEGSEADKVRGAKRVLSAMASMVTGQSPVIPSFQLITQITTTSQACFRCSSSTVSFVIFQAYLQHTSSSPVLLNYTFRVASGLILPPQQRRETVAT